MAKFILQARSLILVAALALTGCNTLPAYRPAAGEKTTTATFYGYVNPFMCKQGVKYSLPVTETKGVYTATVPAGQRIALWTYLSFQGYQVISSCHPALSVVPKEGVNLIINSGVADRQCFIEAVRAEANSETGVVLEPSLGGPQC